jgi:RNA polymerase sigma-70 factor (ECF subfamily)
VKTLTGRVLSWEAHLVERAAQGELVAFELLADLYRPTLLSLATRMLRDSDDARDAVQETLIKAYRAIGDFDPLRPIKPWLCRICANCCVDAVRARKKQPDSLEHHEHMLKDDSENLEDRAVRTMRERLIVEAVSRLPERYRNIITMRHFDHMDVNEIAIALDKPEGTIKSWLYRARALLKKDLSVALG